LARRWLYVPLVVHSGHSTQIRTSAHTHSLILSVKELRDLTARLQILHHTPRMSTPCMRPVPLALGVMVKAPW
jgi:hypothetical protein